jgi:hypothetical protein
MSISPFLGVVGSSTIFKLILIHIGIAYGVPITSGKQEVVIYPIIKVV